MVQPIRYSDDPLLKNIPESATQFEFENLKIIILHREKKEPDFLLVNTKTPGFHYHLFQEKGELYFKKTYNLKKDKKKDEYIDAEKLMKKFSKIMTEFLSKAQKIEKKDTRFIGKFAFFLSTPQQYVKEKTEKVVIFDQNYDIEKILFKNINKKSNKLGFTFYKNGKEKDLILVNDGNIFRIDVKHLEGLENTNSEFI